MASWFFPAPDSPHFFGGGRGCLYSFMHRSAFTLDLGEGIYELTLLKGDILHYCQGLIDSLQEHAKLVTASFHT